MLMGAAALFQAWPIWRASVGHEVSDKRHLRSLDEVRMLNRKTAIHLMSILTDSRRWTDCCTLTHTFTGCNPHTHSLHPLLPPDFSIYACASAFYNARGAPA